MLSRLELLAKRHVVFQIAEIFVGGDARKYIEDGLADIRCGHRAGLVTGLGVGNQGLRTDGPDARQTLLTIKTELMPSMPNELFRIVVARLQLAGLR